MLLFFLSFYQDVEKPTDVPKDTDEDFRKA